MTNSYADLDLDTLLRMFHDEIRAAVSRGREGREDDAREALKRANLIKVQIRKKGGHV